MNTVAVWRFGVAAALVGVLGGAHRAAQAQTPWSFAGSDIYNSHASLSPASGVNSPTQINPVTAWRLTLKWSSRHTGRHLGDPDGGAWRLVCARLERDALQDQSSHWSAHLEP